MSHLCDECVVDPFNLVYPGVIDVKRSFAVVF